MRWPWQRSTAVKPRNTVSISDPNIASLFGSAPVLAGVDVNERSALGISAFYRAVSLVSGTIAQLPLRALRDTASGPVRVRSVLDAPGGTDGQTPYEWVETAVVHLMLHGNAFALVAKLGSGAVGELRLVHPALVGMREPLPGDTIRPVGGLWYDVQDQISGVVTTYDATGVLHLKAPSTDGLRGMSVLAAARQSLGLSIAGESGAARLMSSGAMMGGIASPEDDLDDDELDAVRREITRHASGWENAGSIALVNRRITLSPWTMTARDAQFLESRQFGVEDVARWTGVPPHLLMQTDKQTSWGSGVAEQNRGLARFTLAPWTSRIEQRLTRLLGTGRRAEFDYSRLERPNTEVDTGLVISLVQAGVITVAEGRSRLGLDPSGGAGSAI